MEATAIWLVEWMASLCLGRLTLRRVPLASPWKQFGSLTFNRHFRITRAWGVYPTPFWPLSFMYRFFFLIAKKRIGTHKGSKTDEPGVVLHVLHRSLKGSHQLHTPLATVSKLFSLEQVRSRATCWWLGVAVRGAPWRSRLSKLLVYFTLSSRYLEAM